MIADASVVDLTKMEDRGVVLATPEAGVEGVAVTGEKVIAGGGGNSGGKCAAVCEILRMCGLSGSPGRRFRGSGAACWRRVQGS